MLCESVNSFFLQREAQEREEAEQVRQEQIRKEQEEEREVRNGLAVSRVPSLLKA